MRIELRVEEVKRVEERNRKERKMDEMAVAGLEEIPLRIYSKSFSLNPTNSKAHSNFK